MSFIPIVFLDKIFPDLAQSNSDSICREGIFSWISTSGPVSLLMFPALPHFLFPQPPDI